MSHLSFTLTRIFTRVLYRVAGSSLCSTCAGCTLQRPGKSVQTLDFFFQHVGSGCDSERLSSCQGAYLICVYIYVSSLYVYIFI